MKRKYHNEVLSKLIKHGYDANDFDLIIETKRNGEYSTLRHRSSGFNFIFFNPSDSYEEFMVLYSLFAPAKETNWIPEEGGYINFQLAMNNFEYWLSEDLKNFIEDVNEIDLWEAYNAEDKVLEVHKIDFDDKSTFSLDERIQIKNSINDLKYLIQKNLQTNEQEQKLVEARLDYLVEASNRLNKFDWKSVTLNTIISISITLSLDTEKGRMLFDLFKKVFGVIRNAIPALP